MSDNKIKKEIQAKGLTAPNKRTSRGKRQVTIELDEGESLTVSSKEEFVLVIADAAFYRLGGQVDDIVGSHVLRETEQVRWCSVSQKWVS